MHVHHRHAEPCEDDHGWPDWLLTLLFTLDRSEYRLMSAVQDRIDTLTADLTGALGDIAAEIRDLKGQVADGQPVDLSRLEAAVEQAKGLVPAQSPAPAASVDSTPDAPVAAAPVTDAPVAPPATVSDQPAADDTAPVITTADTHTSDPAQAAPIDQTAVPSVPLS